MRRKLIINNALKNFFLKKKHRREMGRKSEGSYGFLVLRMGITYDFFQVEGNKEEVKE